MEIRRAVDTENDPMEEEALECQHCMMRLAMSKLCYPTGGEGFVCPKCSAVLVPVPAASSSNVAATPTIRDDLGYFFGLLKEADEACKARPLEEMTSLH